MGNFVVYKSSAGSGKTFRLVKEYLRLSMLDPSRLHSAFRRILAVTFTNKAAAEMKKRVIDTLHAIIHDADLPPAGKVLTGELKITAEELRERASTVLTQIIHHYSDLSISTIDSFTHKIVRTFSHDLKLPVNFNVEPDVNAFYDKVIAQLLSKIGEDEYVSHLLKEYVLEKTEANASWDPERHIREFAGLLQKEESGKYLQLLRRFSAEDFEKFRRQFNDFIRHYRDTLRTEGSAAIGLIQAKGLTDEDFRYKKTGPQSFFRKCAAETATLADAESSRLDEAIRDGVWGNASVAPFGSQLTARATALRDFIRSNFRYYSLCQLLGRQMYPLMLLKKIEELSEEQKQEDRLVFISEFNERIYDIIHQEPVPFIYERLGEKYQNFLLDEFQDTSTMQWLNMLPLLDNSLSSGWFNLVVGDGKQSIYRWRNANVAQFAGLPEVAGSDSDTIRGERAATLRRNFRENILDTNYRSRETVITFNNALFGYMSAQLSSPRATKIYAAHSQKSKKSGAGFVTFYSPVCENSDAEQVTLNRIESHIRDAMAKGFRAGDICVLARTNRHGHTVAASLLEAGIPVVSSDSLLLRHNDAVNTLVAWLHYLSNAKDTVSGATVINHLYTTGRIDAAQLQQKLEALARGSRLADILAETGITVHVPSKGYMHLLDICTAFVAAMDLTKSAYPYVRFFLDQVNEYLVTQGGSLQGFLEWWEVRSAKASLVVPEQTDAVKVMTIHASKGLEFPVVIVPFCNWQLYKAADAWITINEEDAGLPAGVVTLSEKAAESGLEEQVEAEKEAQLIDNLNLLYVAFTRAEVRLHIISARGQRSRPGVDQWIGAYLATTGAEKKDDCYSLGDPDAAPDPEKKSTREYFPLPPLEFATESVGVRVKPPDAANDGTGARRRGIVLHQMLSQIHTAADVGRVLDGSVSAGLITMSEKDGYSSSLTSIVTHPSLKKYFSGGAHQRREKALLTAEGELLRPDAVIHLAEETVILDYKSGSPERSHHHQVNAYAAALTEMGYSPVRKLLVYVDPFSVVEA